MKKKALNLPEAKLPHVHLTKEHIEQESKKRISRINKEFAKGFSFIKDYPKSVTFFGSARFKETNPHYRKARSIAVRLSSLGYTIVTGGGPGIMEAANRGAYDTGGHSLGLNIKLPQEQVTNPYVTKSTEFHYFFSRKVALSFSAEAYLYFPGGFGTLDEFFEILTLVQTHRIAPVPIILVGADYWKPLDDFIKKQMAEKHRSVDRSDMKLYTITDDEDEVVRIVENAPLRDE
ncbi:MAG: TIGR00730 family Rossman fold protein [Candidatus Yonathbacteria bacterium CG_4_10_14_3_um_filter_47_65]|uniref:Cytokinin riboside 5'-monophosphate phosphoribohydrolase n=2 Tax=Parcubacteria group TaxID=1794811 RepID=A0A2M8D5S5_9BACT|nr:MAG: Rossman fold protein, TIGR00730 family [Candidatus Nomurabacteria bacterium CG1_02_47_685]PIP03311.1 MAG: TIGR00730 family Rossman fold protein [Candidatus Yonathbacteria bacterium CG23_combo_of_CG06-09_8_20_14_all_46_18]PIQ32049.1 MAG: TIGR00730 family Rossman fold protein [Candidatus Yonathbacteria bacterium CG17_big_fil_post_rev_8_21_14_2_50_46_19]PIX56537.1 MAG: TIGR00730 family Rossman fold protein [Candidatus Yonathbacteria bacterium CG_4_10_14_3_um_filter_47_65]PIY58041.1 MAG: TI